jgi:drug/metabolite transporter (DMT)-like permease
MSNRLKAYVALIIVSGIWGVAGPVIKATLFHIPPFTFLFYRFLIISFITIPWFVHYIKKHPIKKSEWFPLTVLMYLATTVYLGLLFVGFEKTTSIDGTLLGVLAPLFIVILGVAFLREKITKNERIGLAIAMIGTIVTIFQPLLEGKAFPIHNTIGNATIIVGVIFWSLFTLVSKKNYRHFTPLLVTLYGSIVALVTTFPLALYENKFQLTSFLPYLSDPEVLFGLFYMGFLSYLLAYYLYEYGMSKIEISEGSLFTYLHPLFAVPVAYFWLGETVTVPFVIGALLIAVGVVFAERK